MTTPGDESRTELAWREIVEHYGERPVLDDDGHPRRRAAPAEPVPRRERRARTTRTPTSTPTTTSRPPSGSGRLPRRRSPTPRTWQRGVAWAGIFVAPALALVIGLFSIYVAPLVGWALVAWFVGGFGYLVRVMPRSPRDPWDDGSRI